MAMPLTTIDLSDALPHRAEARQPFAASFHKAAATGNLGEAVKAVMQAPVSDEDLLRAASRNNTEAFLRLYDRHAAMVCGVAMRILRDRHAADDTVQAAFLDLWRHAESMLALKTAVPGWLVLTARSRALAVLNNVSAPHVEVFPLEHDAWTMQDPAGHARDALRALEPEQRKLLQIAFFDGLAPDEIAATYGGSVDSVKANIRAALLKLRRNVHA